MEGASTSGQGRDGDFVFPIFWQYPPYFTCVRQWVSGMEAELLGIERGIAGRLWVLPPPLLPPPAPPPLPPSQPSTLLPATPLFVSCSLQPVKETQQKQRLLWKDLILRYCRHHRIHVVRACVDVGRGRSSRPALGASFAHHQPSRLVVATSFRWPPPRCAAGPRDRSRRLPSVPQPSHQP